MIVARHQNFIAAELLKTIHNELLNSNRWVWRTHFWRYYLVDNLTPYAENDPTTWYGNQKQALLESLPSHWRELFNKILDLAGSNFLLQRYALTGQTQGQQQLMHSDVSVDLPGEYKSYLCYLNTQWDFAHGGLTEFQVDSSTTYCEIPEPGKLVVFDSKTLHRGQAPYDPNTLRLSLVLHGKHI